MSDPIIQNFGTLGASRLGLGEAVRAKSVSALNRLLAHTMALRDLYKKAHWETAVRQASRRATRVDGCSRRARADAGRRSSGASA
jgi:hypothetical protein